MSVKLTMGPMSHAQSGGNDFIYRKDLYRCIGPRRRRGAQEKRGAKLLIGFVKKEAANRATAAGIGLKKNKYQPTNN